MPISLTFISGLFPIQDSDLKTRTLKHNCIQIKLECDACALGKAQERPTKTLSFYLRLTLALSLQQSNKQKQYQKQEIPKRGENLMSRVVILLDSNGQCSTQHHKAYKQESATLSKEKKSTETVPEKDLMVDI